MSSSSAAFFSSLIPISFADADESKPPVAEDVSSSQGEEESEEVPEPEDSHPTIRDECKQSSKCAALTKHFEHCQEKVLAGEGFKGEDCVEELSHDALCRYVCSAETVFQSQVEHPIDVPARHLLQNNLVDTLNQQPIRSAISLNENTC